MIKRINGSLRLLPRILLKQNNFPFSSEQQLIKQNISRLTEYLNTFVNKFDNGNIKLDSLKKFLKIEEISTDFINKKIFESEDLKKKIREIIVYNISLEENISFAKFCYYDLQLEKNHHIFQTLLINNFLTTNYSVFKKEHLEIVQKEQSPEVYFEMDDEEKKFFKIKYKNYQEILLNSYPYFTFNIMTVNPLVIGHESMLGHFQKINNILYTDQNFKKYSLIQNINFLNVFPFLEVKVVDSEFFKYVSDEFRNNFKKYDNFNDFIVFFYFMETFRFGFDIKFKVEFLKHFKRKLFDCFKVIIEIKNNPISETLDKGIDIEWRYDDLIHIMSFYIEDAKMINIIEFIMHEKSSTKICPLLQMVKLVDLYKNKSNSKKINNFLANFLAFHGIEHLKNYISLNDFEKYMIIIFGVLCEESEYYEGSETFSEFFEEFKDCVFHTKFIDGENYNISVDTFKKIKLFLSITKKYYDRSFDNYVTQMIEFLSVITTI